MKFAKFSTLLLCLFISSSLYPMYWGSINDYDYGRVVSPESPSCGFDYEKRSLFTKKMAPTFSRLFNEDRVLEQLFKKGDRKRAANLAIGRRILEEYSDGFNGLKSSNVNADSCFEYVLQKTPSFLRQFKTLEHIKALKESLRLYSQNINVDNPNAVQKCMQLAACAKDVSGDSANDLVVHWLQKALCFSKGDTELCYALSRTFGLDEALHQMKEYHDSSFLSGLHTLEKNNVALAQGNFKEAAERNNRCAQCHMAALALQGLTDGIGTYEGAFWLGELLKQSDGLAVVPYFRDLCGQSLSESLKRAIEDGDDMHARFVYGVLLYAEKKWDEALKHLRPVAAQNQQVAQFYVANILKNSQFFESVLEAVAYYKNLLKSPTSYFKKESSSALKQLFSQGVNEAIIPFFEVGLYDGPTCAQALELFCAHVFKNDEKSLQLWPFLDRLCAETISKNYSGNKCAASLLACLYSVKVFKEQDLEQKEKYVQRTLEYLDTSRDMFSREGLAEAIKNKIYGELALTYFHKNDFIKAYEFHRKISNNCNYCHLINRSILELFRPEVVEAFNISAVDAAQAIERLKIGIQQEDVLPEDRMMALSVLGQIYSGTLKPSGLCVKADPALAYQYLNEVIMSGDQEGAYYRNSQYFLSKLIFNCGGDDKRAYDLRLQAFEKGVDKQSEDFVEMGVLAYRLQKFNESMFWFRRRPDASVSQFYTAQFDFMAKGKNHTKRKKSLVEFEQLFRRSDVDFEMLFTNYSNPVLLDEFLKRQENDVRIRAIFTRIACFNNAPWAQTYKQKAFEIVQRDAQVGLPYAQTILGLLYHNGQIVEQSPDQTCEWFKKLFLNEKSRLHEKKQAAFVLSSYMRKSLPQNITQEQLSLGYNIVNFLLENGCERAGVAFFNDLEVLLFDKCKDKEMFSVVNDFDSFQKIREVAIAGNEDAKIVYAHYALMRDSIGGTYLKGTDRQEKLEKIITLLKETKWSKRSSDIGRSYISLVCDCLKKDDYEGVVNYCEQALSYGLQEHEHEIKFRLANTYLTHGKKGWSGNRCVKEGVKLLKELADAHYHKAQMELVKLYSPDYIYKLGCGGTVNKDRSLADKYVQAAAITQVEQQTINPELGQQAEILEKEYLNIALGEVPELKKWANRSIGFPAQSTRNKFGGQFEKKANSIETRCNKLVEAGYIPALVTLADVNLCKASRVLCKDSHNELSQKEGERVIQTVKPLIIEAIRKLMKFVTEAYTDEGTYTYNVEAGITDAIELLRAFVGGLCKSDQQIQKIYGALLARMNQKNFVIIDISQIKAAK